MPRHFVLCVAFGSLGLLTFGAAEVSSWRQVFRFALEGRADLSRIDLANGRGARATIVALGRVAMAREIRVSGPPALAGSVVPVPHRDPADIAILRVLDIPKARRGNLRLRLETGDPAIAESVRQATHFLTRVVAPDRLPRSEIRVLALPVGQSRAYAAGLGGRSSIHLRRGVLDIDTAVHELAHHIEGGHRFVLEAAKRFLARRSRGGVPERMRDLTGDYRYAGDEIALRANWSTRGGSHYTGKFYGPSLAGAVATETISMGLERPHRNPVAFYRENADHSLFLLLVLKHPCTAVHYLHVAAISSGKIGCDE